VLFSVVYPCLRQKIAAGCVRRCNLLASGINGSGGEGGAGIKR